jgi:hypothetical protein
VDELTLRLFDGLPLNSQESIKAMIKLMSYGYTGGGTWNAFKGTIRFERKQDVVKAVKTDQITFKEGTPASAWEGGIHPEQVFSNTK